MIKKINIRGSIEYDLPLKEYSTFKTGGSADLFIRADDHHDIIRIRNFCAENKIPLFVLGGGANILISDKGIRGITLFTGDLNRCVISNNDIICQCGITVNKIAEQALNHSLSGLEFIYGMPGSVGGALWMNARSYGGEISEIFNWAHIINEKNTIEKITYNKNDWSYKLSPFQKKDLFIYECSFSLKEGHKESIKKEMKMNRNDREKKGHFKAPCAGSVFKNNRAFGKPSGQIIDEVGLRGLTIGDASISDFHANIIINNGHAKSSDILKLIQIIGIRVKEHSGFDLEPEVIPVGDWGE